MRGQRGKIKVDRLSLNQIIVPKSLNLFWFLRWFTPQHNTIFFISNNGDNNNNNNRYLIK